MMEFLEKSCKVIIDTSSCDDCDTKACASACKKYARGLLAIDEHGRATVAHHTAEELIRLGTECLACEFACKFNGKDAIRVDVPVTGLDEYSQKRQGA